jgi:hypothetical protein
VALTTTYSPPKRIQSGLIQSSNEHVSNIKELCVSIQILNGRWSYGSWVYNYLCNQCLSPLMLRVRIPLRRGAFDTALCDKLCQWLATGRLFSPGIPVPSTNKTDRYDISELLLNVALSTIAHNHVPIVVWDLSRRSIIDI